MTDELKFARLAEDVRKRYREFLGLSPSERYGDLPETAWNPFDKGYTQAIKDVLQLTDRAFIYESQDGQVPPLQIRLRRKQPLDAFARLETLCLQNSRFNLSDLKVEVGELLQTIRLALQPEAVESLSQEDACNELLVALDELYPLPDDEQRVERAGRTAAVLERWMGREYVTLEQLAKKIAYETLAAARLAETEKPERTKT